MPINADYRGPGDLPEVIPVFPLPGALLLPRGQIPLNIFEPRYLAMVDDALRDGHRLIGMIQPDVSHSRDETKPALFRVGCVGRITQLAEAGDGRYILELTGISRFKVVEEMSALTAYRQCKVDYFPYIDDFTARKGEDAVDREALLEVLTDFLNANNLKVDWEGVESAPNEALVNALLSADCNFATELTVGDIGMGVLSGGGNLNLTFGGASAARRTGQPCCANSRAAM